MGREMEALAADALAGAAAARRGPHPAPTACANCGHLLYGRYCSQCGQSSDLRHRSILHLIWEAFESLLHLDGRLWRTVPALFFRPGTLAKDYLEGRIARHVPPFRTFLVTLVILLFAAEHAVQEFNANPHHTAILTVNKQQIHGRADAAQKMRQQVEQKYAERLKLAAQRRDEALKQPGQAAAAQAAYQLALQDAAARRVKSIDRANAVETGKGGTWFERGLGAAIERPDHYRTVLFEWAHWLAVLLLPITAAWLTLFYAHRRKFYVYDHLIVAMDYLSFVFLLDAAVFLLPPVANAVATLVALIWGPVNLFMTLRGAYGSNILGAIFKALAVSFATGVSFIVFVGGLVVSTFVWL
jgi:hypothetical protein